MTLAVSLVEAVWIALNLSTLVLTFGALIDARADRTAVRLLNGNARELAAAGTVRREAIRVIAQTVLLAIAIPGLFSPDAPMTLRSAFAIGGLMVVSVLLLFASIFDTRDRKAMTVMVAAELLSERATDFQRLEAQNAELAAALAENTAQGAVTETTVEDTATKVADIHDATVKNGGAS